MASTSARDVLRPLRLPGYAFLGVTIVLQAADFVLTIAPLRPLALMWRFATLGSASGNVGNILLLILLLYVFALLLQDRPALLIVSISTAILSLSLILAGAAFSLDAMQLRSRIDAQVVQRFDIASAEAIVKFIAQGIVSALLSLSALRSWRLLTREFHRDERPSEEMVVVRGAPSRTA